MAWRSLSAFSSGVLISRLLTSNLISVISMSSAGLAMRDNYLDAENNGLLPSDLLRM